MSFPPRSERVRVLRALLGLPWLRSDSRGRTPLDRARKRAADLLERAARRLDAGRPTVTRGPGGSHVVAVAGVNLARIEAGHIRDTR